MSGVKGSATAGARFGRWVSVVTLLVGAFAPSAPAQAGDSPSVTSLTPPSGQEAGGTAVRLQGTGFTGATAVTFRTVAATSYTVDSDTAITAMSPARATTGPDTVDVTVSSATHVQSASGDGARFTYFRGTWSGGDSTSEPRVDNLTPLDGPRCHAGPAPSYCGKLLTVGGQANNVFLATAELYDPATREWTPVPGHLATPRLQPSVTVLFGPECLANPLPYCGSVLIAGGTNQSGSLASAELYNPDGDIWSQAGTMASPRHLHTATLLRTGKVLVAGGRNSNTKPVTYLKATEVFDPVTAGWSGGGDLAGTHVSHTATRLDGPACRGDSPPAYCGKVLVAGGLRGFAGTTDVEIFNPAANAGAGGWSSATPLTASRFWHTAVLLDGLPCHEPNAPSYCGQVLVAGGSDGNFARASAETYDPAPNQGAGAWQPAAGSMRAGRYSHSSTLVGGATCPGGTGFSSMCGRVLVIGGSSPGADVDSGGRRLNVSADSAEVYDPATRGWSPTGSLITARESAGVSGLDSPACETPSPPGYCSEVVVAGGDSKDRSGTTKLRSTEVFDPAAIAQPPSVTSITPAAGPTRGGTEVSIKGGGFSSVTGVDFVQASGNGVRAPYHTVDSPTQITVSTPAVNAPGVVAVTVTSAGGASLTLDASKFTYVANTSPRPPPVVTNVSPISGPTAGGTIVTIQGSGLFSAATTATFGGVPATRITFVSDGRMTVESPAHAQGTVTLTVLVDGAPSAESDASKFNYGSGAWRATSPLAQARYFQGATLLDPAACHQPTPPPLYPCGQVLVTGGSTTAQVNLDDPGLASTELYSPQSGTWRAAPPMLYQRHSHTATLLDDGRVLVTGGCCLPTGLPYESALSLAELYDPAGNNGAGIWLPLPPMSVGRFGHTATLLDGPSCRTLVPLPYCGKVLVTGGSADSGSVRINISAEMFDPVSLTWSPAGAMSHVRMYQAAAGLPDGRVLVMGGIGHQATEGMAAGCGAIVSMCSGEIPLKTAEIYDPLLRTWQTTGSMAIPRAFHTATTLTRAPCAPRCGKVLVAGGVDGLDGNKPPLPHPLASTELFDPLAVDATTHVLGSWSADSAMPTAHAAHTATPLPDGRVLVAAGGGSFFALQTPATAAADVFDPQSSGAAWTPTGSMLASRGSFASVLLDGPQCRMAAPASWCGRVLADGGGTFTKAGFTSTAGAELYTPAPTVAALSPANGSNRGGTRVVIAGRGFTRDSVVSFGSRPATGVVIDSTTQITAISPANPVPAAVEVSVANSGGTSARTVSLAGAQFTYNGCDAPVQSGTDRLYPAGYALVGLPGGSVVPSDSRLYSWFDVGDGHSYVDQVPTVPVTGGHGYWAYFSCTRPVNLAGAGAAPTPGESFGLGAYHASMVGNPSHSGPATVSGHDFAAAWDPSLNAGAGGYRISAYQEPQALAAGDGTWVFSYRDTTIRIQAAGP